MLRNIFFSILHPLLQTAIYRGKEEGSGILSLPFFSPSTSGSSISVWRRKRKEDWGEEEGGGRRKNAPANKREKEDDFVEKWEKSGEGVSFPHSEHASKQRKRGRERERREEQKLRFHIGVLYFLRFGTKCGSSSASWSISPFSFHTTKKALMIQRSGSRLRLSSNLVSLIIARQTDGKGTLTRQGRGRLALVPCLAYTVPRTYTVPATYRYGHGMEERGGGEGGCNFLSLPLRDAIGGSKIGDAEREGERP